MNEPQDQPQAESNVDEQSFNIKHAAALIFAIGVTVLIFAFREQVQQLAHLGYAGAFLTMLLGNATLILPVPGLIFVFVLGGTLNPLLVGLAAGPGAALGELTGYFAGYGGSAIVDNTKLYHRIKGWMEKYGLIVISILAAIPNPVFDMAGIVSGTLRIKWWQFLIAAWIGKTIQAIGIAYAGAHAVGWVLKFLE